MSDFQKNVLQSARKVQSLVENIDETNDEMLTVVKQTDQALLDLEVEREKHSQAIPGEKLHYLIQQWADDQVYSPQEMKIYSSELWLSLKEFEKQIKEDERGYLIRYKALEEKYQSHISDIQRKTQFRIEAYESAFIQLKIQNRREIDQLNMKLADIESKGLYDERDAAKYANELIIKAEDGLVLRNTIEARTIINQFVTALKINTAQYETLSEKLEKSNKLVDLFETRLQDKEAFYEEEKKLRNFYQKTLMKMVRELNLFEDDIEKKQKFELIDENEDDLNYQRQISFILQSINLQQACIDHTNKYFGQKEGIIKIQQNLNDIGIIDQAENFSTSEDSENDFNERILPIEPVQTQNKKLTKQQTIIPQKVPNKQPQQKQQNVFKATGSLSPQAPNKIVPQNEAILKYVEEKEKKKKKKEALKQLQTALKDAIDGNLEIPVSTEESGAPQPILNKFELRQKLTEFIADVNPEMLQDFRFTKDQELEVPTPVKTVKKTMSKKQTEPKSVFKKKESTSVSIVSKKEEDKKEQKPDNNKKNQKSDSVNDKSASQSTKKTDEKKESAVNEQKQQDKIQDASKKETQQNKDTLKQNEIDQNQKNKKKTKANNLKIEKQDEKKEKEELKDQQQQSLKEAEQQSIKQQEDIQHTKDDPVQEQTQQQNKVTEEIQASSLKQTQEQENAEKVSVPKIKTPVAETVAKEQQVQQETPQGICLIQQELSKLYEKKFSQILQNYKAEEQKKMKAVQINQLQDFVERTLGVQLPYGERMELFQAEITNFFQKLNELIIKQFDFAKIHSFITLGGQQENKKETKQEKAKNENILKKISFGNFLKTNFSPSGELMGFELRHELVSLMFEFNDQQLNILKRAIKTCLYMNRLLIYGQSNDFLLKQFKDGEMVDESDVTKNLVDFECQVDLIELHANQQIEEEKQEEEELEVTEETCEQLLRDFGIGMMIRMDPENQNKRNYYDMIFNNLSGQRLLSYYLEDVFLTMDDRSKNKKITLAKMFCNFQDQIFNIVYDIQIEQRKQLITEKMLSLSVGYNRTDEKTFRTAEIQATVQTRSIMSYTGNELLSAFLSKGQLIIKKSKNQLILDKALEEEFKMTLDLFDEFAQQLSKLESEAQRKLELENIDKDAENDSDKVQIDKIQSTQKKKLKNNKFKGNEKNQEKVQSVQKIQNEISGLTVSIQKTGALSQQVEDIDQKQEIIRSAHKFSSNAQFMFQNEESLTELTKDYSGYVSNAQLKNNSGRTLQTAQTSQIQGVTNSMKPFMSIPSNRLKQMKIGIKLSEETDPSRIAATKKFNAILRQKLSKIMIKNQNKAIEIDRILNSSTELQHGYSSHFNSIDGLRNGFNTTSMYESLMAGVELDIFKKSRRSNRKQILNISSGIGLGPGEFKGVSAQNADLDLNKSLDQASQVNFENIDVEQPEITIKVTQSKGSRNDKFLNYTKSTVTNSKNLGQIKSQENTEQSSNSIRITNDVASTNKLKQVQLKTPASVKTQKFQEKLNMAMLYRQSEIQRKVLNYDSIMAELTQVPNQLLSDSFYSKKTRVDNTQTTLDKLVHSKVLESKKQFAGWNLINQKMDKIRQGTSTQLSPINFVGIKSPMSHFRSPIENDRLDGTNSPLSLMNNSYDKKVIGKQNIFEEETKRAIQNKIDFDDFKKHLVSKSYHQQVFKELNIKGLNNV